MTVSLLVIALSLSLDSLSVSIAGGLKEKVAKISHAVKVGIFFGGFQAGMPLLGWVIGGSFRGLIASIDHWIAFGLLLIIGLKMIYESFGESEYLKKSILNTKTLLMLSVATSIDAFVVGVSLNLINLPLVVSVSVIGLTTFSLCFMGYLLGRALGKIFVGKVEILGGIALIAIGTKILLEHL